MAEEKDFMKSQDFLGDLFENVGKSTGKNLFEKLSTNARQEALQPLVKSLQIQQFTKPLTELADKAELAQKAGMAAYIAANPEIDESLLYEGTGDLVNGIMQQNNLKFRQLNQQLSFMDVRNPRYQELANELNKINTTSAQLREDNKKLLGIRNLMKDDNMVEELSKGMSSSQQAMYNDILIGNNQNFVNINGKLHWQDPDNVDAEPMAISSVDAAGPTYTNATVMEKHIGLYNEVINAQFVDDAVLHSKINSLWKMDGVGNAGLKSFIFDNQGADDVMGFDTSQWFESWYKDNNIVGEEAQLAEYERIRNNGVLADGTTGNVKQHFSAWYHNKMKGSVASQFNKIEAAKRKNLLLNVDIEGEGNEGSKGGEGTDLLENITSKDQLFEAIFTGDEEDAVTKINEGMKKFTDFLPKGVRFETAQLGFDIIKVDTDPFGVVDSLGTLVADRNEIYSLRFNIKNPADEARFKKFAQIMKIMETKKYPQGFKPSADMGKTYKDLYDIL